MSGEANSYYAGGQQADVEHGNQQHQQHKQQNGQNGGNNGNDRGVDNYNYNEKVSYDQFFQPPKQRKFKDMWAGLLFLATVAGFVAIAVISLRAYTQTRSAQGSSIYDADDSDFGLNTSTIICMVVCVAVAVVLSVCYLMIARVFTKLLIWVTGIANIVLGLGTAIYMLYEKYYSGGIVFLIFAVFNIFCFISWIPRIPFSVEMLRASIDVSRKYGHVYIVSMVGGFLSAAFGVLFSVVMVAVYIKFEPGSQGCDVSGGGCSKAKVIGVMAFITFAGYWITEWLKNTIHASIAGVYGAWYYAPNDQSFPKGATRGSVKRILTRSFGSISLGSLVVAIINALRQLCSIAQHQAADNNNIVATIVVCIVGCLLSILEWAVQFVNRFAFCNIALYGSTYFEAARDTWTMLKSRGIDALVNTCLVGPVFSMGATFVAYATALSAYLFLKITDPAYNSGGGYTPVIVAYAFLVGLQICNVFTVPISSGVDTIFVAMGWDPYVMRQNHAELFDRLVRVYPQVQQAVQGERWNGVGR